VGALLEKLNEGVKHYLQNEDEDVEHITSTMEYSKDDAKEWMGTVKFAQDVKGVKTAVVDDVVKILRKAGVLDEKSGAGEEMVALKA
jgi:vacuolar-type H+-ATPase subunit E/Vma4